MNLNRNIQVGNVARDAGAAECLNVKTLLTYTVPVWVVGFDWAPDMQVKVI